MKLLIAALIAFALFGGCVPAGYVKPTETHRQLVAQTEQAGNMISTESADPKLAQAGKDIADDSTVLRKTLTGEPTAPVPSYSPDTSAKLRQQALDEFKANMPWYQKWAGYLVTGLSGLAIVAGFAARFFPATAPIANIVAPIATALVSMKQEADAHPQDQLSLDSIQAKITTLANLPDIGPILSRLLEKAHLTAAVHSPDGATPATPPPVTPSA